MPRQTPLLLPAERLQNGDTTNHIPPSALPKQQGGLTRMWARSQCVIVEKDLRTGICLYTWHPRPLLIEGSLLQYLRTQQHIPYSSVTIGAFIPGHGTFLTDSDDLLPACKKDIARYFPRGVRVPASEIATLDKALARKNLFSDREDLL